MRVAQADREQVGRADGVLFPSAPRLIVIAASAGGLEPIRQLLSLLPADFPGAIALVQHRGADWPHLLLDLLASATRLNVCDARDGVSLKAGTVYVCPPGVHMFVEPVLRLVAGPKVNFVRPNADLLLDSAAQQFGSRAVAVVLSGYGSDGALGGLSITRAGGTVLAQSPETSEFGDMPAAARRVGAADASLTPRQIAEVLVDLAHDREPLPVAPPAVRAGPIRVMLVDDHQILLDGLRLLVDAEEDLQVVGRSNNGDDAVRRAGELLPDAVVMDLCMPGVDGIEATQRILEHAPDTKVVALSSRSDLKAVAGIIAAGAAGYLTKHRAVKELAQAIRAAVQGRVYYSEDVAGLVASGRAHWRTQ